MSAYKTFWVEDVRDAWRWLSVWIQGTGVAAMTSFIVMPEEQRTALFLFVGLPPENGVAAVALFTFITGIFGRIKNQ